MHVIFLTDTKQATKELRKRVMAFSQSHQEGTILGLFPPDIMRLVKQHVGDADAVGALNGAYKKAWNYRCPREVRIVVDGQEGLPKLIHKLKKKMKKKMHCDKEKMGRETIWYSDDYKVELVIEVKGLTCQGLAEAMNILKIVQLKIYSLTPTGQISTFMAACTNMHTLIISGSSTLDEMHMIALMQYAKVRTLHLARQFSVGVVKAGRLSSGVVEAVKHCLHTLDLHDCAMMNVTALGQCKKLHTLNLSWNLKLANVAGLGQCASLHTLNLSRCIKL